MGTEYGANIQLESGNDTSANLIKFQSRGAPKKSGSSYKHTLSKINPKYPEVRGKYRNYGEDTMQHSHFIEHLMCHQHEARRFHMPLIFANEGSPEVEQPLHIRPVDVCVVSPLGLRVNGLSLWICNYAGICALLLWVCECLDVLASLRHNFWYDYTHDHIDRCASLWDSIPKSGNSSIVCLIDFRVVSIEEDTYSPVVLPHTSSLWQSFNTGNTVYCNRGHLHIGSDVFHSHQPSSPTSQIDCQSNGIPKPLESAVISRKCPHMKLPGTFKNNPSKHNTVHMQSRWMGHDRRKHTKAASAPAAVNVLDLHYQLYGKSLYQSQFERPGKTAYCRTIATRRGICTREFNEEDGFSRRTTAASSFEDPEQEIAEKHDIITSNIDDTDKTLHNTSDRPAMRCRIYDDGRVAKLQQTAASLLEPAMFPPIPKVTERKSFGRSVSDNTLPHLRPDSEHIQEDAASTRLCSTERFDVPTKQQMLHSILNRYPTPSKAE
eukprot:gene5730-214_t